MDVWIIPRGLPLLPSTTVPLILIVWVLEIGDYVTGIKKKIPERLESAVHY
jgi:hypothetical protein